MNEFQKETVDQYLSAYSKIWKRCKEIAEYYYKSGLWIKGIHYISDFEIYGETITIIEQAHGCDLEFSLEDFIDSHKLEEAIKKDIEESLCDINWL